MQNQRRQRRGYREEQTPKVESTYIIGRDTPTEERSNSEFELRNIPVDIKDVARLNLAYWINGKLNFPKQLYTFDSIVSTILGGVLSVRWNLTDHLQALKKWSFKRFYYEFQQRLQRLQQRGIYETEEEAIQNDRRLRSLKILNLYAAQKLGELEADTSLVFSHVTIEPKYRKQLLEKYPGLLDEAIKWFVATVIKNDNNDSDCDRIITLLKENKADCSSSDEIYKALLGLEGEQYLKEYYDDHVYFTSFIYHAYIYPLALMVSDRRYRLKCDDVFKTLDIHTQGRNAYQEFTSHIIYAEGENQMTAHIVETLDPENKTWKSCVVLLNNNIIGLWPGENFIEEFYKFIMQK